MNELESEVMQKLEAADKLFSHWRADSALFQFNATLKTEPQSLHPQLLELIKHAKWMHRQTDGAFDPTIAPLVNLWVSVRSRERESQFPPRRKLEEPLE